jgi:chromosome segregation ATPase
VLRAEDGAAAKRQLATARERIVELERRLEQQDELLANVRTSVDRGAERLAGLEQRLVELREVAPNASPQALERAWDQADRGTERLAALERRLTELREQV